MLELERENGELDRRSDWSVWVPTRAKFNWINESLVQCCESWSFSLCQPLVVSFSLTYLSFSSVIHEPPLLHTQTGAAATTTTISRILSLTCFSLYRVHIIPAAIYKKPCFREWNKIYLPARPPSSFWFIWFHSVPVPGLEIQNHESPEMERSAGNQVTTYFF